MQTIKGNYVLVKKPYGPFLWVGFSLLFITKDWLNTA